MLATSKQPPLRRTRLSTSSQIPRKKRRNATLFSFSPLLVQMSALLAERECMVGPATTEDPMVFPTKLSDRSREGELNHSSLTVGRENCGLRLQFVYDFGEVDELVDIVAG